MQKTRMHLDEFSGWIVASGAVESRIYESDDLGGVDLRAPLIDIAGSVTKLYHDGELEPRCRSRSRAPCRSVSSILNAMKFAWPAGRPGTLTIRIVDADEAYGWRGLLGTGGGEGVGEKTHPVPG